VCGSCHAGVHSRTRSNCVDCHMPLVSPQPPLRFTNHWIGIYKNGAKLKPAPVS
jgi:formate-dependent nitrite reductase cytochrome c552 subunit